MVDRHRRGEASDAHHVNRDGDHPAGLHRDQQQRGEQAAEQRTAAAPVPLRPPDSG